MRTVRVVVVDDSAYNRRTITRLLEELPGVNVVGYAANGEEGIRRIIDLKPDLVTLDLAMPKMDGFTLLRIVMNNCPTPVVVVSSQNDQEQVFKALELGAVDFVAKPVKNISEELLSIRDELQQKVSTVFNLHRVPGIRETSEFPVETVSKGRFTLRPEAAGGASRDVVAIGSSTGGPPALQKILKAFPDRLPFAVAVSQHMPSGFTRAFADRLNRMCTFEVREAADGDLLMPGKVLIAPGGRNMLFEHRQGVVRVRLAFPSHENKYVPSVDAMFASLAGIYRSRLLAVVLTGMGNDGCSGVQSISGAGGEVLAESEESAVVFGMPRETIATGVVAKVVHLDQMAHEILTRCGMVYDTL
jgi:two-component system chemotaxis response regulator CheB